VHGTGQPPILLLPTWAIVDSRHWKMQVPFLARNYRVITFDPSGNGRSDRPEDPAAYADTASASDIAAVLDATGTERAVLVHTSEARLRGTAELETSSSGALMERARHSWQSAAPGLAPLVARRIALPASSVHPTTAGPPGARPVGVTR